MKKFIVTQNFKLPSNARNVVNLNFVMRVVHAENNSEAIGKFISNTLNLEGERLSSPICLELNQIITIE